MRAIRINGAAALCMVMALAACGGGGSGSGGSTAPTTGLPAPSDIVGASTLYTSKLETYLATLREPLFDRRNLSNGTAPGSATFTGIGRITDASVTTADVMAAALRNRSVVTDATATIDFGAGTVTAAQTNFIDVDGAPVAGRVDWAGSRIAGETGTFAASVNGNVGGTVFATPAGQASVIYLERGTESGVSGLFVNGAVTSTGWLRGTRVTGDFAAR